MNMKKPNLKLLFKIQSKNSVADKLRFLANDNTTNLVFLISILIFVFYTGYLGLYYNLLTSEIPLWFSLPWGVYRISSKHYIFLLPLINLAILFLGYYFSYFYNKYNIREVGRFVSVIILLSTSMFWYSMVTIVNESRTVFYTLGSWFGEYFLPLLISFIVSQLVVSLVIKNASKLKIVEYPGLRFEPSQVLQKPTPRGGSIAFFVSFALVSLIFMGPTQRILGLTIGILITTIAGYLDDRFKLGYLPRLLFFLPLAIIIVVLSGFVMLYIPNPFGDPIKLDALRYTFDLFGKHSIVIYGAIVSFVWFLWISNMMSWNNGTDGQFVAISAVSALVVGILSLRFDNLSYEQILSAKIAFITLGALLGLFRATFPPQKIIWGFGATGVGLVLGSLALLSGTRVAMASLVLLIPSIDTLYVIVSRIKHKKSPFAGDRNHLHHKLLDLGWSKKKISLFYWGISILFGIVSLLSSGKSTALVFILFSGLVLFAIIFIRKSAELYLERQK
ncbi:hypothetical protein COV24_00860 [candidate division WWE3 bacterium CG10_big_fil_rev_8_21_14_0_10_32_10]|uniref:Undecaprenyl-phosphate alpha-N-acetylglucosaminyl 1-phosphate transferase n=1 Tax=candidate division WWE3 bacterium CG10_big_fil_rev_8_21_14_0_10_32_10 TaxID=1975090 RepID=A0A2H0RCJ9_UNCKA|nr:MAG: hypothetical protein COV24_00860 [candidate division WWE3 bacterium CG10_big_fil_rev_8_21_14_0_10_32_10]